MCCPGYVQFTSGSTGKPKVGISWSTFGWFRFALYSSLFDSFCLFMLEVFQFLISAFRNCLIIQVGKSLNGVIPDDPIYNWMYPPQSLQVCGPCCRHPPPRPFRRASCASTDRLLGMPWPRQRLRRSMSQAPCSWRRPSHSILARWARGLTDFQCDYYNISIYI